MNAQGHKPAAIVTGQQVRVEAADQESLNFMFELAGSKLPVPVSNEWAKTYRQVMTNVLAKPEKYFSLRVDDQVPTWVFHQREFSFPQDRTPPEDVLRLKGKTLLRIPNGAVQEVQRINALASADSTGRGCNVSLWKYDRNTQEATPIPSGNWKPAILLRFPLTAPGNIGSDRSEEKVYELSGTPQGERYFLDRLELFSQIGAESKVESVSFHLEQKPGEQTDPMVDWTIARTSLSEEARPGNLMRSAHRLISKPYVATNKEPLDALRLLQMLSITNSGGYFLRVASAKVYSTLVVCVTLTADHLDVSDSNSIPLAANAALYDDAVVPDVMRFENAESIQIAPFAPIGHVAFGWVRSGAKESAEDLFAFHTISLVEYRGADAAGTSLQDLDKVTPISPLSALPVEQFEKNVTESLNDFDTDSTGQHIGVAAVRLLSRHQYEALVDSKRIARIADDQRYYRAQMCCYDKVGESPYKPLASEARRTIAVKPGLRDVFGNRFPAVSGEIKQRLFYTDALKAPAEWPGFRFSVFPITEAGRLSLGLEACYTPTDNKQDQVIRHSLLVELRNQLDGARSDVRVQLSANPLLANEVDLTRKLIDWIKATLIPVENPEKPPNPKPLFLEGLQAFPCKIEMLVDFAQFQPKIDVLRTDHSLLPQTHELPKDKILSKIILGEIARASSPIQLAKGPSPRRFGKSSQDDEFRIVARAFEKTFCSALHVKVGFLRNQVNQHELYFIPDEMFPAAPLEPGEQRKWTFSTPRPLHNKLETDLFHMPVFDGSKVENPLGEFQGFPVRPEETHFVEQDYDELGRTAFGVIEKVLTPVAASNPSNSEQVRNILGAKDSIARTLANWDRGLDNVPPYMIPVFVEQNEADGPAVSRLAKDAFLKTLAAFYNIDTVVQLPLKPPKRPMAETILMFFGRAVAPFKSAESKEGDDAAARLPAFSDVLFKAGERKVTLLYDVPPGTKDPNSVDEVPVIKETDDLKVVFTHIQLKAGAANRGNESAFNQGPWLELVSDQNPDRPFELAWKGIGIPIPVALRRFPVKPSIDDTTFTRAALAAFPVVAGKKDARRLIKWGWKISFFAEGNSTDKVHTTIRYNEPETLTTAARSTSESDWQPRNLLHCLLVFKAVSDHWDLIAAEKRLPVLSALMSSLKKGLEQPARRMLRTVNQPRDMFDVVFDEQKNAQIKNGKFEVMNTLEKPQTVQESGLRRVIISARGELDDNKGFLLGISSTAVCNFRASLRLTRNEEIRGRMLDSRLIYECAVVESSKERLVQNSWTEPLQYKPEAKQNLEESLQEFFAALLNGAEFSSLALEVNTSLHCRRGALEIITPFSLIPSDMMPTGASAIKDLANRIYRVFQAFIVENGLPKEVDEAWLRVRTKVSRPKSKSLGQRTLVEISAIDFPLEKRTTKLIGQRN